MSKTSGGVETLERVKTKTPKLHRVLLLNDDYTPMDFVVRILEQIFDKTPAEAVQIMLKVHKEGQGLCGVFPKEIAETKIALVFKEAKASGHPLKAVSEPEP